MHQVLAEHYERAVHRLLLHSYIAWRLHLLQAPMQMLTHILNGYGPVTVPAFCKASCAALA